MRLFDQIILHELAELAKQVGFSNGGFSTYVKYLVDYNYDGDPNHCESYKAGEIKLEYGLFHKNNNVDFSSERSILYEAPTQSLLQQWLRGNHIYVTVASNNLTCHFPMIQILDYDGSTLKGPEYKNFKTYEEALEFGLQEALNLIK